MQSLVRQSRRREQARKQALCRARGEAVRARRDLTARLSAAEAAALSAGGETSAFDLRAAARYWRQLHGRAMRSRKDARAAMARVRRVRAELLKAVKRRASLERACQRRREACAALRERARAMEADELGRAAHERRRRSAD